jgi:hypothetical protein
VVQVVVARVLGLGIHSIITESATDVSLAANLLTAPLGGTIQESGPPEDKHDNADDDPESEHGDLPGQCRQGTKIDPMTAGFRSTVRSTP